MFQIKPKEKVPPKTLRDFLIKTKEVRPGVWRSNPRLKGHHKVYIIRTKSGIPLGAYGGQELAHKHAQRWADRTGEQIVMEVMGVSKK